MKRKRASGGGRKPKAGSTSPLTVRIPDDLRRQLESEAAAKDGSVAERLIWHLRQSFSRKREEERDPALQGLLFLIARLAEYTGGGIYLSNKEARKYLQRDWRTDQFNFRAFKFAVKRLLDELQEPTSSAPRITGKTERELEEEFKEFGTTPEFNKLLSDVQKSPEAYGTYKFRTLWTNTMRTRPLTEKELEIVRAEPHVGGIIEHDFYNLPKARRALELGGDETLEDIRGHIELLKRALEDDKRTLRARKSRSQRGDK
jgi:hypothetical protein